MVHRLLAEVINFSRPSAGCLRGNASSRLNASHNVADWDEVWGEASYLSELFCRLSAKTGACINKD